MLKYKFIKKVIIEETKFSRNVVVTYSHNKEVKRKIPVEDLLNYSVLTATKEEEGN